MAKQITYVEQSRQAILIGVNQLANAVKETLGPRGRNVRVDKPFGSPLAQAIDRDGAKNVVAGANPTRTCTMTSVSPWKMRTRCASHRTRTIGA